MKPQTALPSISIPQPVWNGAGTSLSDAPWSRGRAALFAEVNVSENKEFHTYTKNNIIFLTLIIWQFSLLQILSYYFTTFPRNFYCFGLYY